MLEYCKGNNFLFHVGVQINKDINDLRIFNVRTVSLSSIVLIRGNILVNVLYRVMKGQICNMSCYKPRVSYFNLLTAVCSSSVFLQTIKTTVRIDQKLKWNNSRLFFIIIYLLIICFIGQIKHNFVNSILTFFTIFWNVALRSGSLLKKIGMA